MPVDKEYIFARFMRHTD